MIIGNNQVTEIKAVKIIGWRVPSEKRGKQSEKFSSNHVHDNKGS
jgi:hypothetical protein